MRKVIMVILILLVSLASGCYLGFRLGEQKQIPKGDVLTVTFADSALGCAVIIHTPEGRFCIIDPGPEESADTLTRYLADLGARSLTVVASNSSEERAGALESILASFPAERLYHGDGDQFHVAASSSAPRTVLARGDVIPISKSTRLEVLSSPAPPQDHRAAEDDGDRSLVMRIRFKGKRILLPSDIGLETEAQLIRSGTDLASHVLVVGRRSRRECTSLEFLSRVRPQYCVVSCSGHENRPSRDVMNRIARENTGAIVYRTDKDGTIDMISDGKVIVFEARGRG